MKVEKDQILTSQFGGKFKVTGVDIDQQSFMAQIVVMPDEYKCKTHGDSYGAGDYVSCNSKGEHYHTDLILKAISPDDSQKVIELTDNLAVADETIEVLEDLLVKAAEEIKRLKAANVFLSGALRLEQIVRDMQKRKDTIYPQPINTPVTPWKVGDFPQLGQHIHVMLNGETKSGIIFPTQVGDKAPRDY